MSKTALGVAKDIAKRKYAESDLGKAEKILRDFYYRVERKDIVVSDEDTKVISEIRESGNKKIEEYTKEQNAKIKSLTEERAKVIDEAAIETDKIILEQMQKEIEFINKYN